MAAAPDVETNALRFMQESIYDQSFALRYYRRRPLPLIIRIRRINCFYWMWRARDAYNTGEEMRSRVRHPAIPEGGQKTIGRESAVEDLGLSVRTRNALRAIGCDTVENVLALDLGSSVRGLGRKTKEELLTALELGGFRHPTLENDPASEIQIMERSLDKMQTRVDAALTAVSKEIRLLKQRLRKTRSGVS
jgi:hypothetical protein